jgi:type VI secretion system protein ImpA
VLTANTPTAEVPDLAKLATSIPDAGKICEAHEQVLAECLETAHQIDQFLTNTLGSGNTISFEILDRTLKALKGSLKSFLPGTAAQAEVGAEPEAQQEAASGGPISGISVQGLIRSREDVVRVLESVCNYYKQVEPGSPVPFLLRRAQKLAKMDFIQAMQELNLATVEALRPSMGSAVDGSAASIPAAPAE